MTAFWYCSCRHPKTRVYYADEVERLERVVAQLQRALTEIREKVEDRYISCIGAGGSLGEPEKHEDTCPAGGMSLGTAIGLAEEAFKQKFHREIVVGSDMDKAWFNGYVEALTHDASQAETRAKPAPCIGGQSHTVAHGSKKCEICGEELGADGHHQADPVPEVI